MDSQKNIAPIKLELLLAIVPNDKQAFYSSLIQSQQANLQFTLPCKGTTHLILNYLGLAEKPKSLVMSPSCAEKSFDLSGRQRLLRSDEQFAD